MGAACRKPSLLRSSRTRELTVRHDAHDATVPDRRTSVHTPVASPRHSLVDAAYVGIHDRTPLPNAIAPQAPQHAPCVCAPHSSDTAEACRPADRCVQGQRVRRGTDHTARVRASAHHCRAGYCGLASTRCRCLHCSPLHSSPVSAAVTKATTGAAIPQHVATTKPTTDGSFVEVCEHDPPDGRPVSGSPKCVSDLQLREG